MQEPALVPTGPRLVVEARLGPHAFEKAIVEPGGALEVGRAPRSRGAFSLPRDDELSAVHFVLSWSGSRAELVAKGPTLLGGLSIESAVVESGAWVRAGASDFLVFVERPTHVTDERAAELSRRLDAEQLRGFVLVDGAARDGALVSVLRASPAPLVPLLEGFEAATLAERAPYLVPLEPATRGLVHQLFHEGWASGGLVVCASRRPMRPVRDALRGLVAAGVAVYSPEALRAHVQNASPRERARLFGIVAAYFVPQPDGSPERLGSVG
jgi:hypothetical protein